MLFSMCTHLVLNLVQLDSRCLSIFYFLICFLVTISTKYGHFLKTENQKCRYRMTEEIHNQLESKNSTKIKIKCKKRAKYLFLSRFFLFVSLRDHSYFGISDKKEANIMFKENYSSPIRFLHASCLFLLLLSCTLEYEVVVRFSASHTYKPLQPQKQAAWTREKFCHLLPLKYRITQISRLKNTLYSH